MKQLDQLWSKVAGTEIRLESLYWPPFERKTSKTIFSWKFKRDRFAMPSFVDVQVDGQNFRVRGPAPALINDANENIQLPNWIYQPPGCYTQTLAFAIYYYKKHILRLLNPRLLFMY